jgi:predicted alpha-1,6-mannanase (GH76 family)
MKNIGVAALVFLAIEGHAGISAFAFTAGDAGAVFNSYSKTFYVLDGTNGYFRADQAGGVADFWMQAEEIECVLDAYEWTSNPDYKVMAVNLLNRFEKRHGTNWSANTYNDDCMWASIAFARGYQASGNARFREIAKWNFDMAYARAWDTNLGGGLYWTTANHSKNACVNGPGGIAAYLIFQVCGDAGYWAKASNIYKWERSVLFKPATGAVSDSINLAGKINLWTSTYNQGTFLGLANFLSRTNDAMLAANYTQSHLTHSGILPQYGIANNNSGFNAIFLRWLVKFMRGRGLQSAYQPWLQANAEAAWNSRRITDGLSWCQWRQVTPEKANLHSWDCIASLEALQLSSLMTESHDPTSNSYK